MFPATHKIDHFNWHLYNCGRMFIYFTVRCFLVRTTAAKSHAINVCAFRSIGHGVEFHNRHSKWKPKNEAKTKPKRNITRTQLSRQLDIKLSTAFHAFTQISYVRVRRHYQQAAEIFGSAEHYAKSTSTVFFCFWIQHFLFASMVGLFIITFSPHQTYTFVWIFFGSKMFGYVSGRCTAATRSQHLIRLNKPNEKNEFVRPTIKCSIKIIHLHFSIRSRACLCVCSRLTEGQLHV